MRQHPGIASRLLRGGSPPWWIMLVVFIVTGWGAFILPDRRLISRFTDDSFYYLEVARNVARGAGFTFDGIHLTNGFQPLWQLLLVPLVWALPGDFLPLRGVILLQSALFCVGISLFWTTLRPRLGSSASTSAALLLIGIPTASYFRLGMESALFLLFLVITWRAWLCFANRVVPRPGDAWRLGFCCALLFLSRLEGAFALVTVLILGVRRYGQSERRGRLVTGLVLPPVLTATTYLLWNKLEFGLWLPISGMVKTHWFSTLEPRPRLVGIADIQWIGRQAVARLFGTPMPPDWVRVSCGVIFLGGLVWAWRQRARLMPLLQETGTSFLVLCCGGIMAIDHILVGPFLAEWAMVPEHVLTIVIVGLVLYSVPSLRRATLIVALALCLMQLPVQFRRSKQTDNFRWQCFMLAEWIDKNVPTGERVGSLFSGVLAYFGHRSVVSLDGLVNDAHFYRDVVVGGKWEEYLEENRLKWLTDVTCPGDPPLVLLVTASRGGFRSARCFELAFKVAEDSGHGGCSTALFRRTTDVCEAPLDR